MEAIRKFDPNMLTIVILLLTFSWTIFTYSRGENYQYTNDRADQDPDAYTYRKNFFPWFHGVRFYRRGELMDIKITTSVHVNVIRANSSAITRAP